MLDCIKIALSSANLPATINVSVKDIADLPAVKAGEPSLALVLVNLLENAAEEMNGQGNITIQGRLFTHAAKDCSVEVSFLFFSKLLLIIEFAYKFSKSMIRY